MNTATRTLSDVMTGTAVPVPEHLERDAEVPVIAGLQAQGDLIVVPAAMAAGRPWANKARRVPAEGLEVIRGADGRNPHLLIGDGPITWIGATAAGQVLGLLSVPDDSTAYLLHPEHGANGIAPGLYEVRRQRELAQEVRLVAD